ncbi:MAG: 4-(cytidine 5'-diphospho)-2-C-methyl-D-erythritol kinase [Mangrovibacterium sp.]
MIYFPHCKINLGLLVTKKRTDGYHDIETVFYPVGMQDALEFVEANEFHFDLSGIELNGNPNDNLVVKAYRLLQADYKLPTIQIHLHKNIPSGAGLGGGSADAAVMLTALNDYFKLNISTEKLIDYALHLGSDCPFFINPNPSLAVGRGERLTPVNINLKDYCLVVVKPPIHVSTAKAYGFMQPNKPEQSLAELISLPIEQWKGQILNQFEDYVFETHPEVADIKKQLYSLGADFSLMSGSGSAVFGLFKKTPCLEGEFPMSYHIFKQILN